MIATAVLPGWYVEATLPPDKCACQYGPCGHCMQLGRHDHCHKATGFDPGPSPAAYLISRRTGRVLGEVRSTGRECRWVCPCPCPQPEAAPAVQLGLFDLAAAR